MPFGPPLLKFWHQPTESQEVAHSGQEGQAMNVGLFFFFLEETKKPLEPSRKHPEEKNSDLDYNLIQRWDSEKTVFHAMNNHHFVELFLIPFPCHCHLHYLI